MFMATIGEDIVSGMVAGVFAAIALATLQGIWNISKGYWINRETERCLLRTRKMFFNRPQPGIDGISFQNDTSWPITILSVELFLLPEMTDKPQQITLRSPNDCAEGGFIIQPLCRADWTYLRGDVVNPVQSFEVVFQRPDWRGLPKKRTVNISGIESLAGSVEAQRIRRMGLDQPKG